MLKLQHQHGDTKCLQLGKTVQVTFDENQGFVHTEKELGSKVKKGTDLLQFLTLSQANILIYEVGMHALNWRYRLSDAPQAVWQLRSKKNLFARCVGVRGRERGRKVGRRGRGATGVKSAKVGGTGKPHSNNGSSTSG